MNSEEEFQEQSQRPEHISYKEYKNQLSKSSNENVYLFIIAFFVMLLIFLGIVKQLSPDIDVSITNNNEETEEQDERFTIDERLRNIQREDDMFESTDDGTFSPELEEKVIIPEPQERRIIGDNENATTPKPKEQKEDKIQNTINEQQTKTNFAPVETASSTITPAPALTAKVVVGYYTTPAQADVARGILMESGLNIQPFVRKAGGAYTLQAGSFSTPDKAQSLVNELLRNNFPARIIYE